MRSPYSALAAGALLCLALPAQGLPIAYQDFSFRNRTSNGSSTLQARVYYPGQWAGIGAPIRAQAGGYPVYVFLHGHGSYGHDYFYQGQWLAERGYVVVLTDTAPWDQGLLFLDAVATVPTLVAENNDPQSFFRGALDMGHAAIGGYSVGGLVAMRVLAANAGYLAGFAHAPTGGNWIASGEFQNNRLPFAIVQGQGDTLVNWTEALQYWSLSHGYTGQKLCYLMNGNANHINVASIPSASQIDRDVFTRAMKVCSGFLDTYLKDDAHGLDEIVGAGGRSEPLVAAIYNEVEQPRAWGYRNGPVWTIRTTAEPGPIVFYAALTTSWHSTPFGDLLLDPATTIMGLLTSVDESRLCELTVVVPDLPILAGKYLAVQALARNSRPMLRLTGLAWLPF